jgi:hypothetical protein
LGETETPPGAIRAGFLFVGGYVDMTYQVPRREFCSRISPMRFLPAIFLLLVTAGCAAASPERTSEHFLDGASPVDSRDISKIAAPVVVMLEHDPWLMVIGSDSPTFALYADGTAIWQTKDHFRAARLSLRSVNALLEELQIDQVATRQGQYTASQATDQPQFNLHIYRGTTPASISVYGDLDDAAARSRIPTAVLRARDTLKAFTKLMAQEWLPPTVEVMVWPYEYAPEPSIVWPNAWPGLNSADTVRRGDGYSIFVPSGQLQPLRAFLAGRNEKGAVEIGNKKWAASIRYPFPHEELWMHSDKVSDPS